MGIVNFMTLKHINLFSYQVRIVPKCQVYNLLNIFIKSVISADTKYQRLRAVSYFLFVRLRSVKFMEIRCDLLETVD